MTTRPAVVTRLSDLIGATPLFELLRTPDGKRVLLKLEQFNPTGSAKIRMARSMLDAAERDGSLPPGGTVVESTSGNTGQGLSVLARERGYRFIAVVDHHSCKDKLSSMRACGTELVYVSDDGDDSLATSAREDHAEHLGETVPGAVFMRQHDNDANAVGYFAAADEIVEALGGPVSHLVSAVGTGGSLFGVAERLRALGHDPEVIGVEPEGSIAFGGPGHDYHQSGTGTPEGAVIGTAVRYDMLDAGIKVGDREAFATCRAVARRTGLLLGGSAGGAVYAALELLPDLPPGATTLTMVCDGGEKYLDTVFDDEWLATRKLHDEGLEQHVLEIIDALRVGTPLGARRSRTTWTRESKQERASA